jgi:hypothetical protein
MRDRPDMAAPAAAREARAMQTMTYTVNVSGDWTDPRTKLSSPRTETYRVLARRPADAQMAAAQLFTAAAALERCTANGTCRAEAML